MSESLLWYAPNQQSHGLEIAVVPEFISFHEGVGLATPVQSPDTTVYELGNFFGAFTSRPVWGLGVWSGGNDTGLTGRKGRLWQVADNGDVVNQLLAEVDLPATMPSGWSQYIFDNPVTIGAASAGDWYCVSYSTNGRYGVITDGLTGGPDDGVIQYTASGLGAVSGSGSGRFSLTQGHVPDNGTDSFYVDVLYL